MAIILIDAVGRRVEFNTDATFFVHNDDGTRTLITIADLDAQLVASNVTNDSSVAGATVKDALDTLDAAIPTTVTTSIPIMFFIERNDRNLDEQWNGTFIQETTSPADGSVSSGSPVTFSKGIGKIVFVVNAGSDIDGTIVITGDTVDRDTGAITAGNTETITIDALTTDTSDTDAEGNVRHAFSGVYITSEWFMGSISVATTNLTITDMDVFSVSFEQFNDVASYTIQTFDIALTPTNNAAWFYAYLYTLDVDTATKKADLVRQISLEVAAADSIANSPERLRLGNQGIALDGTNDGFWVELFFGPDAQRYWENVTAKIWSDVPVTLA